MTGLTAAPQLARIYDAILDARFDELPRLMPEACAQAPKEACHLLQTVGLWWQVQMDPHNTSRDAAFQMRVDASIAAAEAWTVREPRRAEAWFYLGGAYGARVQWRVLRGHQLAAARDGKRIKDSLEQALALDPALQDAYFGVGLYHYYAAVAPTAAKVLRWLLFLPGGDRATGLQEMERARTAGLLVRSEAAYQLHLINLWYEKAPRRAIELLAGLREGHDTNPHFLQATAEIEDVYLHDAAASLRSWEALLAAARAGRVTHAALAETTARLGGALQLDRLGRSAPAMDHLRVVIAAAPAAPYGALALAHLQLADVLARTGRRTDAASEYRLAISTAPPRDPLHVRDRANTRLRALR